ncbi:olfactory receptor class A-like protein 1 [Polypterus senegalus]|nr:olfactory receptor class A-like protein 1 [Polypterus senegalus]
MDLSSILKAMFFLILNGVGIPGNTIILGVFTHIAFTERKLLPADVLVAHLSFVNLFLILTQGIPQTFSAFAYKDLYNTPSCQFLNFTSRVTRALSISMTFLLSIYQCITIAAASSRLSSLKPKLSECLWHLLVFFWLLDGSTTYASILYGSQIQNVTVQQFAINLGYCLVQFPSKAAYVYNGIMYLTRDLLFVILMAAASIYILVILYQHRKRVQGIHSRDRLHGTSVEIRAAKTVVTLVTFFVIFFGVDNMIWVYTLTDSYVPRVLNDVRVLSSSMYAAVCPVVVIISNRKVKRRLQCIKPEKQVSMSEVTASSIS